MIGAERSVYSEKRTGGDRVKMDRSLPAQANGAALTAVLIGRRAEHMAWMQVNRYTGESSTEGLHSTSYAIPFSVRIFKEQCSIQ